MYLEVCGDLDFTDSVLHYQGAIVAQFIFFQWIEDFLLKQEFEFIWDEGNNQKNFQKHEVTSTESEEAFFDEMLIILGIQITPQCFEERFGIMGKSKLGRLLFISFTVRQGRIRVISARSANKKEQGFYEK